MSAWRLRCAPDVRELVQETGINAPSATTSCLCSYAIDLLACTSAGAAAVPAPKQERFHVDPATEVPLTPGWTALDLAFDGNNYHVLGQFNNIDTVHSNYTFTFVGPGFLTVFFEPGKFLRVKLPFPSIHALDISTWQGADYQLASVRLLVDKKEHATYIVFAVRDFGRTFVDSEPVTIELFKLERLSEDPGNAPRAFLSSTCTS